LVLVVHI